MNHTETKFYIGADSGGTKFELLIVSLSGKILKSFRTKGIHYSVAGPQKYSEKITEYIQAAVFKSGLEIENCMGICIGLAGAREESDRTKLAKLFKQKTKVRKIIINSDAMTALIGAFEGKEGIILISGTGSVLYGYYKNKIKRIGGWGRIIGDEGSGYWIGKKALNVAAKEFDRVNDISLQSSLCKKLFSEFGIDRSNLNDMIFKENFDIQKITPHVLDLAGKKSKVCIEIIETAVEDLIYHIKTYLDFVKPVRVLKIALIGSLIENENILSVKLKKEILKLKKVKAVEKKHSPAYGAYLLISGGSNLLKKN
ncbi:MAG: BadF/BadG/BcrA/BcrD ATPase family protein [Ignavibacteria bacterium]